jgi:hypothetical protein
MLSLRIKGSYHKISTVPGKAFDTPLTESVIQAPQERIIKDIIEKNGGKYILSYRGIEKH